MAKKNSKEVEFKIQLLNIELLELNILRPQKPLELNQPVHFNIGMEHRFDIENKIVFVAALVNVIDQPENSTLLGKIATSCNFKIENLDDFVETGTDKVRLPEQAIITLNSIAISTTRGILFSELRGTHLHAAILPVLEPSLFSKVQNEPGKGHRP